MLVLGLLGRLALVLAMIGDPSTEVLTHAAAFKLGDSCTWSEDSRDMMLSVYRSHNASTTDYVCHVAQFCEDNDVSQARYCWPFVLEVARSNARQFNGKAPFEDGLKVLVALARCPSAHNAAHRHAQHASLTILLMEKLVNEPYFQEA